MIVDRTPALNSQTHCKHSQFNRQVFTATGLAIIEVSGQDAAKFLQGQLTCNINDLTESQASIAAFCNAKGRVISTLLVVKTPASFLLILPIDLLDTVVKKLRIYILRAQVQVHDQTGQLYVSGLQTPTGLLGEIALPTGDFAVSGGLVTLIKLAAKSRYLVVASPVQTEALSENLRQQDFKAGELAEWRYGDISTGMPWFGLDQSEQHIPQMLNIDQLGGVSFNKGCYTGQEIIARSHYLGKVKRALFVAESAMPCTLDSGGAVLDGTDLQNLGCVLTSATWDGHTRLLLVLQIVDGQPKNLILDDDNHTPLALISDQ